MLHIHELPYYIMIEIFRKIHFKGRIRLEAVCKRWKDMTDIKNYKYWPFEPELMLHVVADQEEFVMYDDDFKEVEYLEGNRFNDLELQPVHGPPIIRLHFVTENGGMLKPRDHDKVIRLVSKCKPESLTIENANFNCYWWKFLEGFIRYRGPRSRITLTYCRFPEEHWPDDMIFKPIDRVNLVHVRIDYINFLRLIDLTLPYELRIYGKLALMFLDYALIGLVHHNQRLETLFMFDVRDPDFVDSGADLMSNILNILIERNTPCSIVYNSYDFETLPMFIGNPKVNSFVLRMPTFYHRGWAPLNYSSRNVVTVRDVLGNHVFEGEQLF